MESASSFVPREVSPWRLPHRDTFQEKLIVFLFCPRYSSDCCFPHCLPWVFLPTLPSRLYPSHGSWPVNLGFKACCLQELRKFCPSHFQAHGFDEKFLCVPIYTPISLSPFLVIIAPFSTAARIHFSHKLCLCPFYLLPVWSLLSL